MVTGVTSATAVQKPVQGQASPERTAAFSEALKKACVPNSTDLNDIFERAAARYNVPVNLLKAVAKAESGFRADAVSRCGAQGIMQLMPSTAAALGVKDSFDPEQNIMGGAKYLGQLLSSFHGDAKLAVAAYNAGSGAVRKYGGVPPYAETQNYVKKVLRYAGMDLSVPETAYTSGTQNSSSTVLSSKAEEDTTLSMDMLSAEFFHTFAKMYVQRLEQDTLEELTEHSKENISAQSTQSTK
jgi:hypothetical protein